MPSPYEGHPVDDWLAITEQLIAEHPLDMEELTEIVFECWDDILATRIADRLQVGLDVFPPPTMMGNFLHSLVPVELAERYPGIWGREESKFDKDIVHIPDSFYSVEVKTSSHPNQIFGNRSYAQPSAPGTKPKDGYYLGINFEKFAPGPPPRVMRIAFGWLDHSDWIPQVSEKGQAATVSLAARVTKMPVIYPNS